MTDDQPTASSSTTPLGGATSNHHLVTCVFDIGLSREAFSKVIEPNGTLHRLIQRLMEKHGGEDKVYTFLFIERKDSNPV
jgi:hypothetical protein